MDEANVEALAENIKKIRKDNNLSKKDMAQKCGISVSIYQGFEGASSTARMSAATLVQIALEFEVSIDYLLGLTKENIKIEANKEIPILRQKIVELELIDARYRTMKRTALDDASKNARLVDQNNKLRSEIMSLKQNPEGLIKPLKNEIAVLKQQLETSEARVSKLIDKL